MTQIGVRALKAQLSEHLRRAQAGERYLVTDRGAVIAALGPADVPREVAWALTMVAQGQARWNGGKALGLSPRIPSRGTLASAMVSEDRR